MENSDLKPIEKWDSFFIDWQTMRSLEYDRWEEFFSLFNEADKDRKSCRLDLNERVQDLESFFTDFDCKHKNFLAAGNAIDIWNVAGIKRRELPNTSILAWLWDCRGDHGQGDAFLKNFMSLVYEKYKDSLPPCFPCCELPERYITRTEICPGIDNQSRVDIEILGSGLQLFVEVKIDAAETGNQLSRYLDIIEMRREKERGVIYLTPGGKSPDDQSLKSVVPVSWKDVALSLERTLTGLNIKNSMCHFMVSQFSEYVRSF
ncbi:PD-(D/E)XK nuclease family protein [Maridesulfovibrio sp.]|uniref:PDDEXK-like family protein n=1 Tax=Maridesulfovibrio sp. TaxID=2795000 RepID=UPI002AA7AC8F|nr:PD-(D/E)XK nuclease family protein [Maridesulfovibrio sp.]